MDDTLEKRTVRKCYLITYSQVDKSKSADKETFCNQVIEAFDPTNESKIKPIQWACCEENHEKGGTHYHMCIKLSDNKRWLSAASYLRNAFGINVHFSNKHYNYLSAYRYVMKEDHEPYHSPGHPNMDVTVSPQTSKASKSRVNKNRDHPSNLSCTSVKRRRLSKVDVMTIIQQRNIQTETDLLALASEQAEDGLDELKAFIAETPERVYSELISKTWKMSKAIEQQRRSTQSRMARVLDALNMQCGPECSGKRWLQMAKEILRKNEINVYVYAEAIRSLLEKGRGKHRNIMIYGQANCGKTFLLHPLTRIFDTFINPSSSKYAFVGSESKEIIFLNDLRWNQEMIPWQEFLNLLEGQTVHLAAPKTHYARDICITQDIPIFATSISMVKYSGKSDNCQGENAMMEARWKAFELRVPIPRGKQIDLDGCARCFAELCFIGADED